MERVISCLLFCNDFVSLIFSGFRSANRFEVVEDGVAVRRGVFVRFILLSPCPVAYVGM